MTLLHELGAIDGDGRITDEGRKLRRCRCRRGWHGWCSMPRSEHAARTAARDRHGD